MSTATPAHPSPRRPARARRTGRIRVASVPASHVYVRHLASLGPQADLPEVVRLPDPDPRNPARSTRSAWWPPVMLDPAWIRSHQEEFDLFHLQLGFDARSPEELRQVVDTLRACGKPLVLTVHDLLDPRQADRAAHDARLDVLVPAADQLITLTAGAANEIERRWGRAARVLPHPHVVDFATMERLRRRRATPAHRDRPFTVGMHVKSLRAGMDPLAVLPALLRSVGEIPGAVLQVDVHRDVLEPGGARFDPALADGLARAGDRLDLRVHEVFSDRQLWDYLSCLDASVLPYRFGTHSRWLEACRDLGTAVIAPTCGFYAEQGPVLGYTLDEDTFDEESLVRAVRRAYELSPAPAASVEERAAQRHEVAEAHAELYLELLGRPTHGG
jgi:beta-1,4-mannosyltransferase